MTIARFACCVVAALTLAAQDQPQQKQAATEEQRKASIGGTVRDATTGEPIAGALVNVRLGAIYETTKTSVNGQYSIKGLDGGWYILEARLDTTPGLVVTRRITVRAGQDLQGADLLLKQPAVIAGLVTDENKTPLAGVRVTARWLTYFQGTLQHWGGASAVTDDQGEYRLQGLYPGREYVVVAGTPEAVQIVAGSGAAAMKKTGWERLYYPNSPAADGAVAVGLQPGEVREGVDFRMRKRPSFCVAGRVTGAPAEGARVTISIADRPPGWSVQLGDSATDEAGRFSACGLPPGEYQADARPSVGYSLRGVGRFRIYDRNVTDLALDLRTTMQLKGEFRWAGTPPARPLAKPVRVVLMPAGRNLYMSESLRAEFTEPGEFTFPSVFADPYTLKLYDLPQGVYAKEISYGGISLLRAPLAVGTAPPGDPIRITLAHDGGAIRVLAADRDRKPVQDAGICVIPEDVGNAGDLAYYYVPYGTDQDGYRTIENLAPGKYFVLATLQPYDATPANLTKLLQARSQAKEIDLAPGRTVDVTLEPISIR